MYYSSINVFFTIYFRLTDILCDFFPLSYFFYRIFLFQFFFTPSKVEKFCWVSVIRAFKGRFFIGIFFLHVELTRRLDSPRGIHTVRCCGACRPRNGVDPLLPLLWVLRFPLAVGPIFRSASPVNYPIKTTISTMDTTTKYLFTRFFLRDFRPTAREIGPK